MDFFRCLAITLILSNDIFSEAVRQRDTDAKRYSRTSDSAEQIHSPKRLEDLPAAWTEWTIKEACSISCGGVGYLEKERNCSTGNVTDCSSLEGRWWSVDACDNGPCRTSLPTWTEWNSQTACSESCGKAGFYEVKRNCSTGVVRDCEKRGGLYWEIRVCDNGPCVPIWLEWTEWESCSKTCGTGVKVRYRNCSTGNKEDCTEGKGYELTVCNTTPCSDVSLTTSTTTTTTTPIPAVWSEWSGKVSCSTTCGPGFGESLRTCSSGNNDDCTGKAWKVYGCNLEDCIVDGYWGSWQAWSNCPVSCGGGKTSRSRSCIYPDPTAKGESCKGDSTQTQDCGTNKCPVDGVWTSWLAWSQCSMTCDEGEKTRSRTCSFPSNAPHGKACSGLRSETSACKEADCAVDGSWASWSSWSVCTRTCGDGLKFRARNCLFDDAKPRGMDCSGDSIDRTSCNETPCTADGVWSDWSSWSQCTHTCNGGKQSHERVCTYAVGATRGKACIGDTKEYQDCGLRECPVNGIWAAWGPWATCSKSCGGGTQAKTRTCLYRGSSPSTPHGQPCPGERQKSQACKTQECPVDAKWSIWSAFGPCNATCGRGFRVKTRTCIYPTTAPMGRNCTGIPVFSEECNPQPCPVDGTLTDWENWSHCTATCDSGTRYRYRECHFPKNVPHGANCTGSLREDGTCNDSPCPSTTTTTTTESPVDGHWSNYGPWSDCTVTCGGGLKTRVRNCTYPDMSLHGKYCTGPNNQTADCNTKHCPVDGHWSNWSGFGRCSATCGNGTHVKTRRCEFDERYDHGANCSGISTESGTCWAGDCPVDGVWADWGAWHPCSVTCGGGIQERTRICFFPKGSRHGDNCTGETHQNQTCATDYCPVDGNLTEWSSWTECPVTCGGGIQLRNRTCDFPADRPRGNNCTGDLEETKPCSDNLCPVDGYWQEWQTWQTCSVTCGGGTQNRKRKCIYDRTAPHGEKCQGPGREDRSCNTDKCPVDGHWTPWSRWSKCSVSCENGTHARVRSCVFLHDAPRGNNCTGNETEEEGCNDGPCPVDGKMSGWSVWSDCTVTCGNGTKLRNRSCEFPDGIPHGKACTETTSDSEVCNLNSCPVDGYFGAWGSWSSCSVTCGGGSQDRQRACIFDDVASAGKNCTGNFNESQSCNSELCAVDGVWSEWSNFTACTETCGNGTRIRTRKCEFRPLGSPHGENCTGSDTDTEVCGTDLCPVDGKLSAWSSWTSCSKSCDNGTQEHNRTCDFDTLAPRGNNCTGDLYEIRACNKEKCPINGLWSEWSNYITCTVTCAGGTQVRNRTCVFDTLAPHGATCFGNTTDTRDCNTEPCPVDGQWGDWNAWHDCSKSCGGGQKVRDRECEFPADIPHGKNCTTGQAHDIAECNTRTCPVDGTWGDWSAWTDCSATCGGGVKFHKRDCEFPKNTPHGANCTGAETEQDVCNEAPCPVDGQWSDWASWETCSVTCGGGTQARNRNCTFNIDEKNPAPYGKNCTGSDEETQNCSSQACPVDGKWSDWSEYSPCTKSCGNGTTTRSRTCEYLPLGSPQGNKCTGEATETKVCNTTECPQDAYWTDWGTWTGCSATCGGGNQTRDRVCKWPSSVHGNTCSGDKTDTQSCSTELCAVDGVWSEWTPYSTCSATCDLGRQTRTRNCTYDDKAPHGATCPGKKSEAKFCRLELCVVDGVWSMWTAWSACSVTCGDGGESTRTRMCAFPVPGAPHGKNCTGDRYESRNCDVNNSSLCAADGEWGAWGSWSICSVTCGHGDIYRTRSCVYDDTRPRGHDCPIGGGNETQSCTKRSCPVNGEWLTWSPWSACTATCGGGEEQRNRKCYFQPHVPQGDPCLGAGSEVKTCNNDTCKVDGVLSDWEAWSACSVTCGGGTQTRNRTCEFIPPDAPHGKDCTGDLAETISCSQNTCLLPTTPTTQTTTTQATTTTPLPTEPRSCFQCLGPPVICEKLNAPQECPLDKHFCINTLQNFKNASRIVTMRCGTRDECQKGWFEKYSSDDKCTRFSKDFIYTNEFNCEFCCDSDDCNWKINPDDKWLP